MHVTQDGEGKHVLRLNVETATDQELLAAGATKADIRKARMSIWLEKHGYDLTRHEMDWKKTLGLTSQLNILSSGVIDYSGQKADQASIIPGLEHKASGQLDGITISLYSTLSDLQKPSSVEFPVTLKQGTFTFGVSIPDFVDDGRKDKMLFCMPVNPKGPLYGRIPQHVFDEDAFWSLLIEKTKDTDTQFHPFTFVQ